MKLAKNAWVVGLLVVYCLVTLAYAEDDGDDDGKPRLEEPTCPYVADDYQVEISIAGQEMKFDFNPSKWGISSGYYCALSTAVGDKMYSYTFENCTCGTFGVCNPDWGIAEVFIPVLGTKDFYVGQCEPKGWVIAIMALSTVVFVSCLARLTYILVCGCRRQQARPRDYHQLLIPAPREDEQVNIYVTRVDGAARSQEQNRPSDK